MIKEPCERCNEESYLSPVYDKHYISVMWCKDCRDYNNVNYCEKDDFYYLLVKLGVCNGCNTMDLVDFYKEHYYCIDCYKGVCK